ncbi:MAG: hypothetical protein Q8R54_03475 [Methylobacter sp.]|nr:hypothetical protein [Methylobacter sp.]
MSKFFGFDCIDRNCLLSMFHIHRMANQQGIYRRSFKVAFIVGTLLNLINQPQAMFGFLFLDFPAGERLNIIKMLLTYAVPFLVASYVALTALDIRQNPTRKA